MKQVCAIWTGDDHVALYLKDSEDEATAWKDGISDCCQAVGGATDEVACIALPMNVDEVDDRDGWLWPSMAVRAKIATYAKTVGVELPESFTSPRAAS